MEDEDHDNPYLKIEHTQPKKPMKDSKKKHFYTNDQVEKPKKMVTQFRSPLLKKIYTFIDAMEISIFDHQRVASRNQAINLVEILNGEDEDGLIDLNKLRCASFKGIPDTNKTGQSDLRSVVWRVLLGVYPPDPTKWEEHAQTNLQTYELWKSELVVTTDQISLEYDDQMQFARDFQAAKKEHKEKKIFEIRNKKQMPYGPN